MTLLAALVLASWAVCIAQALGKGFVTATPVVALFVSTVALAAAVLVS